MSNIWELDFYSRPLLDANNKKIWELLICDRERQFEWVR
ncbi:MAG: Tab2/Atab2 family RNA-binding protein, partial [Pseudanabaena sp.]